MRKFLIDALEAAGIAAAVVAVTNGDALIAVGSLAQLEVVGIALLRAMGVAALAAVAPRVKRLQK